VALFTQFLSAQVGPGLGVVVVGRMVAPPRGRELAAAADGVRQEQKQARARAKAERGSGDEGGGGGRTILAGVQSDAAEGERLHQRLLHVRGLLIGRGNGLGARGVSGGMRLAVGGCMRSETNSSEQRRSVCGGSVPSIRVGGRSGLPRC